MAKISLQNMTGVAAGELELQDSVFAVESNNALVQEIVVAQLANRRRGTASTKRRDEVRGGGIKPWKQKGTGRARAGSIRSPLWVGGGSVFGPKPRKYTQHTNKKKTQLALKTVLSEKLRDGGIVVLDKIEVDQIKTKPIAELLRRLNADGNSLVILNKKDEKFEKSAKNLADVKICTADNVSVYDLLRSNKIIFDKLAITKVEQSLLGNG